MRAIGLWVALAAGGAWGAEAERSSAQDVKKQAGKTLDAAGQYLNEKKDEFERRAGGRIDALEKDLAELKAKAAKKKEHAKQDVDDVIGDAETKGKEAQRRLGDLKRSSGEAWRDLKQGVSKAVDDFADGVDRAKKR